MRTAYSIGGTGDPRERANRPGEKSRGSRCGRRGTRSGKRPERGSGKNPAPGQEGPGRTPREDVS